MIILFKVVSLCETTFRSFIQPVSNLGGGALDVTFGINDGLLEGNVKVGGAARFQ